MSGGNAARGDRTSSVTFDAVAGRSYTIQVDGWNGTDNPPWFGGLILNWHLSWRAEP